MPVTVSQVRSDNFVSIVLLPTITGITVRLEDKSQCTVLKIILKMINLALLEMEIICMAMGNRIDVFIILRGHYPLKFDLCFIVINILRTYLQGKIKLLLLYDSKHN